MAIDRVKVAHWIASGTHSASTTTKKRRDSIINIQQILQEDPVASSLLTALYERQQQNTLQIAVQTDAMTADYEQRGSDYKKMNKTYGCTFEQLPVPIKDDIDALTHLATLLSTLSTHPNQIILGIDRVLRRNDAARMEFQTAKEELMKLAEQADSADLVEQTLAELELIDPVEEEEEEETLLPRTSDLDFEVRRLHKKTLQHDAKYMQEKEKLTKTANMYGKPRGLYSFEDLEMMKKEIVRIQDVVDERTKHLAAFEDLPPDLDLAEFRLNESRGEYQALQQQLEDLRSQFKEQEGEWDEKGEDDEKDQNTMKEFDGTTMCRDT